MQETRKIVDPLAIYREARGIAEMAPEVATEALPEVEGSDSDDPLGLFRQTKEWRAYEARKYGKGPLGAYRAHKAQSGKHGMMDALEVGVVRRLPYIGGMVAAYDAKGIWDAAERIGDGKATQEDYDAAFGFLEEGAKDWGILGGALHIMLDIPAFGVEIKTSGGLATAARMATAKGLGEFVERQLARAMGARAAEIATRAGAALLDTTAGLVMLEGAQSVLGPGGRATASTYHRIFPELGVGVDDEGDLRAIFRNDDQSFAEAFPQGFLDMWIEFVSERSGGVLTKAVGLDALKSVVLKGWIKKQGSPTLEKMLEASRKGTLWHGPAGEFLEERFGAAMRAGLGGLVGMHEAGDWGAIIPSLDEALMEAIAFTAPGAAAAGLRKMFPEVKPIGFVEPTPAELELFAQETGATAWSAAAVEAWRRRRPGAMLDAPVEEVEPTTEPTKPTAEPGPEAAQEPPAAAPEAEAQPAAPDAPQAQTDPEGAKLDRAAAQTIVVEGMRRKFDPTVRVTTEVSPEKAKLAARSLEEGVEVVWFTADGSSQLQGGYFGQEYAELRGVIFLDARLPEGMANSAVGAQVYHETMHWLAENAPKEFARLARWMARIDPKGFTKRVQEYAADYHAATGLPIPAQSVMEEGVATGAEVLAPALEWLRDPANEARLAAALQVPEQAPIFERAVTAIANLLRRIARRAAEMPASEKAIYEAQAKELEAIAAELGLGAMAKPEAAAAALRIRRSLDSIQARMKGEPADQSGPSADSKPPSADRPGPSATSPPDEPAKDEAAERKKTEDAARKKLEEIMARRRPKPAERKVLPELEGLDGPALLQAIEQRAELRQIPATELVLAPEEMQYKSGTDATGRDPEGPLAKLKDRSQWSPVSAGTIVVFERASGELVVADGHQRVNAAKRLSEGGEPISLNAFVIREADGIDSAQARAFGAILNTRAGTGKAVDAAKILRDLGLSKQDLKDLGVGGAFAEQALGLSQLADSVFSMVVNDALPANLAAPIGHHIPRTDEPKQLAVARMVLRTARTAEMAAEIAREAARETTFDFGQPDLFGDTGDTKTLLELRTELMAEVIPQLKRVATALSSLSRHAGAAQTQGVGQIDQERAAALAADSKALIEAVRLMAGNKGTEVNYVFTRAAEELGGLPGEKRRIAARLVGELEALAKSGRLLADRDGGGEAPPATGQGGGGLFDSPGSAAVEAPKEEPAEEPPTEGTRLADVPLYDISRRLKGSDKRESIVFWRKQAEAAFGIKIDPATEEQKRLEEAVELWFVNEAARIVRRPENKREAFEKLVALYDQMPALTTRTGSSEKRQAYSTPLPLAYVVSQLAKIREAEEFKGTIYEPTAGLGALLIEADSEVTATNELDGTRREALTAQGFEPTANDAATWAPSEKFDRIVMNPPFGAGETKSKLAFDGTDISTNLLDHLIPAKALTALKDNGRAVLMIQGPSEIGEGRQEEHYKTFKARQFFAGLYRNYNVVEHFTVSGALYERQGAGWPVDIIVIEGRGESKRDMPHKDTPRKIDSWDELGAMIEPKSDAQVEIPEKVQKQIRQMAEPLIKWGQQIKELRALGARYVAEVYPGKQDELLAAQGKLDKLVASIEDPARRAAVEKFIKEIVPPGGLTREELAFFEPPPPPKDDRAELEERARQKAREIAERKRKEKEEREKQPPPPQPPQQPKPPSDDDLSIDGLAGLFSLKRMPFYSALTRAVHGGSMPKKGPPEAFIAWLDGAQRRGEFKKAERDWSGIDRMLQLARALGGEQTIFREEVFQHIREQEIILDERVLSNAARRASTVRSNVSRELVAQDYAITFRWGEDWEAPAQDNVILNLYGPDGLELAYVDAPENIRKLWDDFYDTFKENFPLFEDWSLPLGRDYREWLLTAPALRMPAGDTYTGGHYSVPNIVTHARTKERDMLLGGETQTLLFIEELQSDWAKEAREKFVYPTPFAKPEDWVMLAFKRMVAHAVERKYKQVAWTTGLQQARRYNQSHAVESISAFPAQEIVGKAKDWPYSPIRANAYNGERTMKVRLRSGQDIELRVSAEGKIKSAEGNADSRLMRELRPDTREARNREVDIFELFGKETASSLLAATEDVYERPTPGLAIGGLYLKRLYDKVVPAAVNSWAKRLGGKVSSVDVFVQALGQVDAFGNPLPEKAAVLPQPSLEITDAMREAVKAGLPMFSLRPGDPVDKSAKGMNARLAALKELPDSELLQHVKPESAFGYKVKKGDGERFTLDGSAPKATPEEAVASYIKARDEKAAALREATTPSPEAGAIQGLFSLARPGDFDPDQYEKAAPFFAAAARRAKLTDPNDADKLVDVVLEELLGKVDAPEEVVMAKFERMLPYIVEFVADVKSGRVEIVEKPPPTPPVPQEAKPSRHQVPYVPGNDAHSVGALVPANMAGHVHKALQRLRERLESAGFETFQDFLANRLRYDSVEEVNNAFHAEQIDALALAIDNLDRGAGFVIGDQTGVGKGRFVAGILRYADILGYVPVFVTAQPKLYADMVNDLRAIGSGHLAYLVTNNDLNAGKRLVFNEGADVIETGPTGLHQAAWQEVLETGRPPEGRNVIFTTYSQFNRETDGETGHPKMALRHNAMVALAKNAIFVLDESHQAGGQKAGRKLGKVDATRARFVRELLLESKGAVYSSATWAKNPDVTTLYMRTDLGLAFQTMDALVTAMHKGGVPLMQMVSSALARSGQYVRRERSFDKIEFKHDTVLDVDQGTIKVATDRLRGIFEFDLLMDEIRVGLEGVAFSEDDLPVKDGGIGAVGETNDFGSVLHNLVAQLLLSLKAPQVVEQAATAHEQTNIKPVIAVYNTGEAILKDWVKDHGLKDGDSLEGFDFRAALLRYLKRTREVPVKNVRTSREVKRLYINDKLLAALGYAHLIPLYNQAKEQIENTLEFAQVPGSPIDWIVSGLEKRGISMSEITGRHFTVDYSGDVPKLSKRKAGAQTKQKAIDDFNSGRSVGALLNASGAEGASMHASRDFADQRIRRMFIAQASAEVNIFVQILGRTNRFGQEDRLPSYEVLSANVALERRFSVLIAQKLASLNANTTSARESDITIEEEDLFTSVGDRVVWQYLVQNPTIAATMRLQYVVLDKNPNISGLAKRVSTRISLLYESQAADYYSAIDAGFKAEMAMRGLQGINLKEAPKLEIDGRVVEQTELRPANGKTEFQRAVTVSRVDMIRLRKPLSPEQIDERIATITVQPIAEMHAAIDAAVPAERARLRALADEALVEAQALEKKAKRAREKLREAEVAGDKKAAAKLKKAADSADNRARNARSTSSALYSEGEKIEARGRQIKGMIATYAPGAGALLTMPPARGKNEPDLYHAVSAGVRTRGTGNPLAPSNYTLVLYTQASAAQLQLPLSQIFDPDGTTSIGPLPRKAVDAVIDREYRIGREEREILGGNMLRAFEIGGRVGQLAYWRDVEGVLHEGLILPPEITADELMKEVPAEFGSQAVMPVVDLIKERGWASDSTSDAWPRTKSDVYRMAATDTGSYVVMSRARVKASRKVEEIVEIAGQDWVRPRSGTRWYEIRGINREQGEAIAEIISKATGEAWLVEDNLEGVRGLLDSAKFSLRRKHRMSQEELDAVDTYNLPTETMMEAARRKLQDDMIRWKVVGEAVATQDGVFDEKTDVHLAAGLASGRIGGKRRVFAQVERRRLLRHMAEHGITTEELGSYMYARHAPARNAVVLKRNPKHTKPGAGEGWDTATANTIRKELEDGPRGQELMMAAEMVYDIRDRTLALQVQHGLISEETALAWREVFGPDWVPLRSETLEDGPRTGSGFQVFGSESKRVRGRVDAAENPLVHLLAMRETAIWRAEINKVWKSALEFVTENPDPAQWQVTWGRDPNPNLRLLQLTDRQRISHSIGGKKDGKQYWITVRDPLLARSMHRLGQESGPVLRFMLTLSGMMSALHTVWNPEFALRNFIRDYLGTEFNLAHEKRDFRKQMRRNIAGAMRGIAEFAAKKDKAKGEWALLYMQFLADGGWSESTKRDALTGEKALLRRTRQLETERKQLDPGNPQTIRRFFDALVQIVPVANQMAENGLRLAVYKAALDAGRSRVAAANAAREVTVNFSRRGELGLLGNAMFLFYTAGANGSVRVMRQLKNSRETRMMAGGLTVFGLGLSMLNRMVGGDDEDGIAWYDKVPMWVRERSLVLMLPQGWTPSESNPFVKKLADGGYYLAMPMPWGYNVFAVAGDMAASSLPTEMWGGGMSPAAATGQMLRATWGAFSPLAQNLELSAQGLATGLSPWFAAPTVELATNRKWYGGPIMPDEAPGRLDHERYFQSANPFFVGAAKALYDLPYGGKTLGPATIDVSPETLEHLAEFFAGGAGRFARNAAVTAASAFNDEKLVFRDVPFLRVLAGEPWEHYPRDKFYQHLDLIRAVEQQIGRNQESGDMNAVRVLRERYSPVLKMAGMAESYAAQLALLRKAAKNAPPEQRDRVEAAMRRIYMQFNRQMEPLTQ